jgi:hypothetical protein
MLRNFHTDCNIEGLTIRKRVALEIEFPNVKISLSAISKSDLRILEPKNLTASAAQLFEKCSSPASYIHNRAGLKV